MFFKNMQNIFFVLQNHPVKMICRDVYIKYNKYIQHKVVKHIKRKPYVTVFIITFQ